MSKTIRVTVWNEFRHEKKEGSEPAKLYPAGMHEVIAKHLSAQPGIEVRTATLDEPEHGLTEEVLANTDVLTWWGHIAHNEVSDEIVDRVHKRVVNGGIGFIALHSAHM
ncbi:MAG TPA: ThuA domain-containing protein, partial [Armatimonadota bacterium]|nr:ThuA domain-containing protein [Armatimonadota bacterium]